MSKKTRGGATTHACSWENLYEKNLGGVFREASYEI